METKQKYSDEEVKKFLREIMDKKTMGENYFFVPPMVLSRNTDIDYRRAEKLWGDLLKERREEVQKKFDREMNPGGKFDCMWYMKNEMFDRGEISETQYEDMDIPPECEDCEGPINCTAFEEMAKDITEKLMAADRLLKGEYK